MRVRLLIILALFGSCERFVLEHHPENTPENNFNVLWETLDRKYAYFEYKNVDWDSIYTLYRSRISEDMNNRDLYQLLHEMLLELKDGHTNIWSEYGRLSYRYYEGYPKNFNYELLVNDYFERDYLRVNSVHYKDLGSVGYMYIADFSSEITDQTVNDIMNLFMDKEGVIIDVRNNGGGNDTYSSRLARRFFDEERIVETINIKTGPGHNSFTPITVKIAPAGGFQYLKPVAVLTNRRVFSAANSFVSWLSVLPHVAVIGDTTGGGAGTPYQNELPNGWQYRYSANQAYRVDGWNMDLGIPPDYVVYFTDDDHAKGMDPVIEKALEWIGSQ